MSLIRHGDYEALRVNIEIYENAAGTIGYRVLKPDGYVIAEGLGYETEDDAWEAACAQAEIIEQNG